MRTEKNGFSRILLMILSEKRSFANFDQSRLAYFALRTGLIISGLSETFCRVCPATGKDCLQIHRIGGTFTVQEFTTNGKIR
jgi:hypothetical protein